MSKFKTDYFDTLAIHGGSEDKNPKNALNAPIFMTSTFEFNDLDHVEDVMSFKSDDYVYTRGNNPTLRLLEERVSALEVGVAGVAFSSGMAAISSVLLSLLKPGDKMVAHKTLYGSSHTFSTHWLDKYSIHCESMDLTNIDQLNSYLELNKTVKVVYFETPCNPTLQILDIEAISLCAHHHDVRVVIDNTFATPYLQQPLKLGADVVVHSATKYLGGHGDVVAGIAVGNDLDYIHRLKFEYMCELGGVMSPFNAWLILRGIKTLPVRMDRHCSNAMKVATFLENHPKIKKVFYPGLPSFSGYELARKQMRDFGAVIAFEIEGDFESAKRMVDATKLAKLAVSLGDCETLIELPAAMTHRGYDRETLAEFGLSESQVRISVGLEDARDIIEDLRQAIECI